MAPYTAEQARARYWVKREQILAERRRQRAGMSPVDRETERQQRRATRNLEAHAASQRKRQARKRGSGDPQATVEYAAIVRRDPCSYCPGESEHADHIEAIDAGGCDEWDNLTGACRRCNSRKGTLSLLEFLCRG